MSAPVPAGSDLAVLGDEQCPECRCPAVSGWLDWHPGNPWPISRRLYRCQDGHWWTHESDGG